MKKIIVLTVGGSPTPIISSIREYKPSFVYFICSKGPLPKGTEAMVDGAGEPCGDKRKVTCTRCGETFYLGNPKGKSIVLQTSLNKDQYQSFALEDPDDLTECYKTIEKISKDIEERFGEGNRVIANYTGGTKTMSVALAYFACLKPEWKLGLNIGPRRNTYKVDGHDVFMAVDKTIAIVDYALKRVHSALKNFDYSLAEEVLKSILQEEPLDQQNRRMIIGLQRKIEVFNLWDHFMHAKALELIHEFSKDLSLYVVQLKDIVGKLKKGRNAFAKVADLLNNARRRALQQRYDDAVARLYRATEMFAQVILKSEYGLQSSSLSLDDLKEPALREKYAAFSRDNKGLLLGLEKSYELLADLGHEAGGLFLKKKNEILSALIKRNNSIMAHGETPLTSEEYDAVWNVLYGFLKECASHVNASIEAPQLPRDELFKVN